MCTCVRGTLVVRVYEVQYLYKCTRYIICTYVRGTLFVNVYEVHLYFVLLGVHVEGESKVGAAYGQGKSR